MYDRLRGCHCFEWELCLPRRKALSLLIPFCASLHFFPSLSYQYLTLSSLYPPKALPSFTPLPHRSPSCIFFSPLCFTSSSYLTHSTYRTIRSLFSLSPFSRTHLLTTTQGLLLHKNQHHLARKQHQPLPHHSLLHFSVVSISVQDITRAVLDIKRRCRR